MTTPSITSGQLKQVTRFTEDAAAKGLEVALAKVSPDQEGMQRVIEHGDEYTARIENAIETALRELSITNQFANEEVASTHGYLSGYRAPKSIADQLIILRQYFPNLGAGGVQVDHKPVPAGAEGYFAIPRWQAIAATYGEALELVLDALKKQRKGKFENYRKGQLDPSHLRETDRKRLAFERLASEQSGQNVLVLAAQFGLRHRGRSVRRARAVMGGKEFGLGAFEIGIMLLTHPDRLMNYDDLYVDCSGDEFTPDADGRFECCPYFCFYDGRLGFGAGWFDFARGCDGSASAFFPQ